MRSSPVIFSPGTASPPLPVEVMPVEAQPFNPQIAAARISKMVRNFISEAKRNQRLTFLHKKSRRWAIAGTEQRP
jgi:hypothetical protein